MSKSDLCVAYSADDNYAKYLGVSMLSLLRANKAFSAIHVFVLDCGIEETNRARLRNIAQSAGREIIFIPVVNIEKRLSLTVEDLGISIASYARLFIPSLLPEQVERVVYLDCDTIIVASLKEMWDKELGNALVAGIQDTVDRHFREVIFLSEKEKYLNTGVLLINVNAWREERIEAQFTAFISKFQGKVPHHDQGTINGLCKSRRVVLPIRYNVMSNVYSFTARTIRRIYFIESYYSQSEIDDALRNPAIIHFTSGLFGRPWEEGCTHPERDRFLALMQDTPWRDEPLKPCSLKRITQLFGWFYTHMPRPLFEVLYRALSQSYHFSNAFLRSNNHPKVNP